MTRLCQPAFVRIKGTARQEVPEKYTDRLTINAECLKSGGYHSFRQQMPEDS